MITRLRNQRGLMKVDAKKVKSYPALSKMVLIPEDYIKTSQLARL